jgi:hypothetical protein
MAANQQLREVTGSMSGLWYFAMINLEAGNTEAALEALDTWASSQGEDRPYPVHARAMFHLERGEQAEFEQKFEELRALAGSERLVAMVLTRIGEYDEAIEVIDDMIDPPESYGPPDLNTSLMLSDLHNHPRWEDLLRKRGTHPDQIAEIKIDEFFPGPGLPPSIPVDAP